MSDMTPDDEHRYRTMVIHCLSDHGVAVEALDLFELMWEHSGIHEAERARATEHHVKMLQPED